MIITTQLNNSRKIKFEWVTNHSYKGKEEEGSSHYSNKLCLFLSSNYVEPITICPPSCAYRNQQSGLGGGGNGPHEAVNESHVRNQETLAHNQT